MSIGLTVGFRSSPATSAMERVASSEAEIQKRPSVKQAISHFNRFMSFCKEERLVMGFLAVAAFLTMFMLENQGHTASLSLVLSHLRTQHSIRNLTWLTESEEKRLKLLLDQYRLEDQTPVNRVSPLRTSILMSIINKMNLNDVVDLLWATLMMLSTQALLRTAEVTSGLRASDFIWKTESVVIKLGPTKTNRSGAPIFVELADNNSSINAFKLLRKLYAARNLHQNPDAYVFCMVRSRVLYPTIKSSGRAFRTLIKRSVASIGLNPDLYNGHSCRAGGATDLFAAGIPYYVVKKYGRWATDTALLYYRCESSIARTAAMAFQI